ARRRPTARRRAARGVRLPVAVAAAARPAGRARADPIARRHDERATARQVTSPAAPAMAPGKRARTLPREPIMVPTLVRRRAAASPLVRGVLVSGLLVSGLAAQAGSPCDRVWQPGQGVPGVFGTVWTTLPWDPDGPGPRTPVLVVGGVFRLAGDVRTT